MYLLDFIPRKMWLLFVLFVSGSYGIHNSEVEDEWYKTTSRKGKIWPIEVGIVRFQHNLCTTLRGYDGTCYTKRQCKNSNGIAGSSCAMGIGVCCIYRYSCGATSAHNNTYFVNPGFPNTNNNAASCTLTIRKCTPDTCQVRLDFLNMHLAQPDGNGNCNTDSIIITGGASNVPRICGENSGQHIYLNFNDDNDIKITINTGANASIDRSWTIKVTQIGCDCPTLAPAGCLMYYTALTGTVNSFNYGTTLNGALITLPDGMLRPGTREMVNLNYGVCIQMQPGYCSIQWSQASDPYSFTVSGNTALQEVSPGLPSGGLRGANCTTDFVVIPNPYYTNGTAVNADRFCGNQFPTVTTSSKPFVLTVVTNGDDMMDIANRGFSLKYRQIPCSSSVLSNV